MFYQVSPVFVLLVLNFMPVKSDIKDVEYGLAQAQKVAQGVCFTEKLKATNPNNIKDRSLINCLKGHNYVKHLQLLRNQYSQNWTGQGPIPEETQSTHKNSYIKFIRDEIRRHLPSYSGCDVFVAYINEHPNKDYGWFLGESERSEYPYKGYTHCLLEAMEFYNGMQSLDEMKTNWEKLEAMDFGDDEEILNDVASKQRELEETQTKLKNSRPFAEVMLELQNKHRARHGVPPLEMDEELAKRAQWYADQAGERRCGQVWMEKDHPDMYYEGSRCGENSNYQVLGPSDEEVAVRAATMWYKEKEDYPWPVFDGSYAVWRAQGFGEFTQSVWKNTKRVGYGLSRGTTCKFSILVARYWPAGNKFYSRREEEEYEKTTQDEFEENVFPLVNSASEEVDIETTTELSLPETTTELNLPETNTEFTNRFTLPGMSSVDAPFVDLEPGIIQVEKVTKGVCWAEKFNNPLTNCFIWADYYSQFVKHRWYIRNQATEETLARDKSILVNWLHSQYENNIKRHLPGYEVCVQYLEDISKTTPKDYGGLLGYIGLDPDSPHRGYANCLLEMLENRNGQKALEDLKAKWESPKSLQEMMIEAENRHRTLHGVPPMELDNELTKRAQRWANYLSNERCEMVHMFKEKPDHPDLTYKGKRCGESLGRTHNLNDTDDEIGLQVAAQFYKEIEIYPWPAYDGDFTDALFPKIAHFTQTVWKNTSLAGYAIARGSCPTIYVVARYWPPGNTMHAFDKSVFPTIN